MINYRLLERDDIDQTASCFADSFTKYEPLTLALNISYEDFVPFARQFVKHIVNLNLSYIAEDNSNIVGFCLCEDLAGNPPDLDDEILSRFSQIFSLLEEVSKPFIKNHELQKNEF